MVGKNAAYDLLKSGAIKSFRIGRIWKIPRDSLTIILSVNLLKSKQPDLATNNK